MADGHISIETLRNLLRFEPEAGLIFWRHRPVSMFTSPSYAARWNTRFAGRRTFNTITHNGYQQGVILRKILYAHRVMWAGVFGSWPDTIDHINGDRADNRITNLRSVSQQENLRNQSLRADNSSGVVGVNWHSQNGRWRAAITVAGKSLHLGCFDSIEAAASAREDASRKFGFHPNHGRSQGDPR